jgi:hypothetical protein
MTVMGQDAREIYRNQGALKQQLAEAAGVRPGQIYFYNQTANSDARTGVTAMSVRGLRVLGGGLPWRQAVAGQGLSQWLDSSSNAGAAAGLPLPLAFGASNLNMSWCVTLRAVVYIATASRCVVTFLPAGAPSMRPALHSKLLTKSALPCTCRCAAHHECGLRKHG